MLNAFSSALNAFVDDLQSAGLLDQVVVLAFSEFGRRVSENGTLGTDHGTAGSVFLAGSKIRAGLHGHTPSLTDLEDGDLKTHVDFRSIYADLLANWLRLPTEEAIGPGSEEEQILTPGDRAAAVRARVTPRHAFAGQHVLGHALLSGAKVVSAI